MKPEIPEKPYLKSATEIIAALDIDPDQGLSSQEAKRRLKSYGYNALEKIEAESPLRILLNQFKSILILLLVAAVCVSYLFSEWLEGTAILVVILLNTFIGFFTEIRAIRSMEALLSLTKKEAQVLRDGEVRIIEAELLVPGDIMLFEAGELVVADIRIIEASKLQANESSLTGESMPVEKSDEVIKQTAPVPLAERNNMLFKGTALTRGTGKGLVLGTGSNTELGKVSQLMKEASQISELTPLERRLTKLGRKLIWVLLLIIGIVAISGIILGKTLFLVIETSIALAVSTVPEGLPIIATIVLARGMQRMAKHNALINRLSSVETLGSTNVICTDKTGTLTENEMTVGQIWTKENVFEVTGTGLDTQGKFRLKNNTINPSEYDVLLQTLKIGALCNNSSLINDEEAIGDPLEVALLIVSKKANLERSRLLKTMPEKREVSFDPSINLMATYHEQDDDEYLVAVKGAPEAVIANCSFIKTENGVQELARDTRSLLLAQNDQMAEQGLRVIALAMKITDHLEGSPYNQLTFLGLAGLLDPPRKDIKSAIQACQSAGIRVIMVTGDHRLTARNIAQKVGIITAETDAVLDGTKLKKYEEYSREQFEEILEASVFARVQPAQKLYLIDLHQKNDSIVAMTGDGVNDAPALKKANIGIAMGQRGTEVAKEAADMILQDDSFPTIVDAVKHGRIIFENIRTFIIYLISCNLSEILLILLASLFLIPLPILPLQILFLNLVTDIFPAFALGANKGNPKIMQIPPRKSTESLLTKVNWIRISIYSFILALSVFGAFLIALFILHLDESTAVTVSFVTLGLAQTWHVFNMRDPDSQLVRNQITKNKFVWVAILIVIALLLITIYLPGLNFILNTVHPGIMGWILIITASLIPIVIVQVWITLSSQRKIPK